MSKTASEEWRYFETFFVWAEFKWKQFPFFTQALKTINFNVSEC